MSNLNERLERAKAAALKEMHVDSREATPDEERIIDAFRMFAQELREPEPVEKESEQKSSQILVRDPDGVAWMKGKDGSFKEGPHLWGENCPLNDCRYMTCEEAFVEGSTVEWQYENEADGDDYVVRGHLKNFFDRITGCVIEIGWDTVMCSGGELTLVKPASGEK